MSTADLSKLKDAFAHKVLPNLLGFALVNIYVFNKCLAQFVSIKS